MGKVTTLSGYPTNQHTAYKYEYFLVRNEKNFEMGNMAVSVDRK